ncbi:DNA methylase [Streptomyces sp. NPDC052012]|uniref:DNA methylase n=1 Tax=Streptomyces sp. NPDC052012 TaxID=3155051 RepID=UPI00344ED72D
MRRPRVLDLFCCAGGASMGYWRAGFDVVGVDIVRRASYPFPFVEGDALDAARELCQDFDLVHYSPPCQASCALTKGTNRGRRSHIDPIPQVREVCEWYGVPYVIENVQGADLRKDLLLCGEMFGLGVIRHRYFEVGLYWRPAPAAHRPHRGPVRGWRHGVWRDGPYIAAYGKGGGKGSIREMQRAMGITWTDVHEELTEAIPPAYTEYIGRDFIADDWGARAVPDASQRMRLLARREPHPAELGMAA